MQFVQFGFKDYIDEEEMRTWKTYRMFAKNNRPLFQNFLAWQHEDYASKIEYQKNIVPTSMHLFNWLERNHALDSGFLFSDNLMADKNSIKSVTVRRYGKIENAVTNPLSNDPLDLMEQMAGEGYVFSKWTAAYLGNLKTGMNKSPIIFFSAAKDAVMMRLSYSNDNS